MGANRPAWLHCGGGSTTAAQTEAAESAGAGREAAARKGGGFGAAALGLLWSLLLLPLYAAWWVVDHFQLVFFVGSLGVMRLRSPDAFAQVSRATSPPRQGPAATLA